MGPWALKSGRLDLRLERCPPLNTHGFQDPGFTVISGLFVGLFDVTRPSGVAGWVGVPGVWHGEVDSEVNTEVILRSISVKRPCKLSKTGSKLSISVKQVLNSVKQVLIPEMSLYALASGMCLVS